MLLSLDFLKAIYGISCDSTRLAKRLTMTGLEIDDVLPVAPAFSGVIVAQVKALEKHPNADKLNIAQVDTGTETLQIVCGAPNVAVGIKVPLATIGAILPHDLTIKKGKLRGVESFGMLCSARELGISEEASGLLILPDDAPVGQDIRDYLQLDDIVLDINVTPNRGDCLSLRGLAREISVILPEVQAKALSLPQLDKLPATALSIQNDAPQACPLYMARKITGIQNTVQTPAYIKQYLERSGIRVHDPIVDITNYVMLLLGTPLHAFDAARVQGGIHIRFAQEDERLTLLNGNTAKLSTDMLLIADDVKALAVAGVMGGAESACQAETREIILESAWFDPVTIAGKARALTVSSDSAQRFERGVDFTLQQSALDFATQLIIDICGGNAESSVCVQHTLPQRPTVTLPYAAIEKRLGRCYDDAVIRDIFARLGCQCDVVQESYQLTPPAWRFDLSIAEDFIEEIARIDGYENIEQATPSFSYQAASPLSSLDKAADTLSALGYHEAITYSFIDPKVQQCFFPEQSAQGKVINLQNPISANLAQMRLSLIPGLVQTVQYNRNRQEPHLKLFEIGRVFLELDQQPYRVAGALSGLAEAEQWSHAKRGVDFYDAKAAVELLIGSHATYLPSQSAFLHPNKSADIVLNGEKIGIVGAMHPECLKQLGIKGGEIYVFELDGKALCRDNLVQYQSLNKFPSVRRDLSFLLDKALTIGDVILEIQRTAGERLRECYCFDIFSDSTLGHQHSVSFALIFQEQKTLNEDEIEQTISAIIARISQHFSAQLR